MLIDSLSAARDLGALRTLGVRVSIDDFGTGFTSIGQLQHLPADELKIDQSFIASSDPAHHELVELMSRAAHAFGLHVVVEGIEEVAQLRRLDGSTIESAQGFHFARPQPAAQAFALITMPHLPGPVITSDITVQTTRDTTRDTARDTARDTVVASLAV